VLAITDGEIYRIKIQKRGYGRAVYLRHTDGGVSVYAHLDRYSSELGLEQEYQQTVTKTGSRYPGDIFLEPPVRVQKGTVIAYSGETGAGLPHLHLEMRRDENTPVNPFSTGLQDSLDPEPPRFQAIYMYPLGPDSAIDGELETHELRLKQQDLYFIPAHTPVVRGDFQVSVSVYDPALRPYHRVPHRLTFSVDGREFTTIEFNEFSYGEQDAFGLLYDQGKPGSAYYELPILMTRPVDIPAPFVRAPAKFSGNTLGPGAHTLQIEAADANGNTSMAMIQFIVNQPPNLQVQNVSTDGTDLIVETRITDLDWKTSSPAGLAAEVEYSIDEGKTFIPFPMSTLDLAASSTDATSIICRSPLVSIGSNRALIKARGFDGIEYSNYTILSVLNPMAASIEPAKKPPAGRLTLIPFGNAIQAQFDSDQLIPYPVQAASGGATVQLQSWNLTSYRAVLAAPRIQGAFSMAIGDQSPASIQVNFVRSSDGVTLRGENYELQIDRNALYADAFLWPKQVPAYQTRYLSFAGPILELGPRGLPLRKRGSLAFRYSSSITEPQKLSVYLWSRSNQRWESLPSIVDTASRTVRTNIRYIDLFALIFDNVPPAITNIFPKRNSVTRNEMPKLAAQIRDTGMDVDDEKITFFVDNKSYAAEYDPDRNLATLQIEEPLAKGTHSFYVVAYDWGGNRTESKKVFWKVK
jgi:hypothetical protein